MLVGLLHNLHPQKGEWTDHEKGKGEEYGGAKSPKMHLDSKSLVEQFYRDLRRAQKARGFGVTGDAREEWGGQSDGGKGQVKPYPITQRDSKGDCRKENVPGKLRGTGPRSIENVPAKLSCAVRKQGTDCKKKKDIELKKRAKWPLPLVPEGEEWYHWPETEGKPKALVGETFERHQQNVKGGPQHEKYIRGRKAGGTKENRCKKKKKRLVEPDLNGWRV